MTVQVTVQLTVQVTEQRVKTELFQCCESYGKLACCVETELWWKWPALIASSSFLVLTFALLYYTYRSTSVSKRESMLLLYHSVYQSYSSRLNHVQNADKALSRI